MFGVYGVSVNSGLALMSTLMILALITTLIVTIVLAITVAPDKKRDKLKGFGRTLNDIFNFRGLLIEAIVKFLYILITVAFIVFGFFMLFVVVEQPDYYYDSVRKVWYGWIGIIIMVVGPILTRFVFESAMLFILLVKNTIQINNKLKDQYAEVVKPAPQKPAPQTYAPPAAPVAPNVPPVEPEVKTDENKAE